MGAGGAKDDYLLAPPVALVKRSAVESVAIGVLFSKVRCVAGLHERNWFLLPPRPNGNHRGGRCDQDGRILAKDLGTSWASPLRLWINEGADACDIRGIPAKVIQHVRLVDMDRRGPSLRWATPG